MTEPAARILLVDDDDGFRTSTAALLSRDGFAVDQAADAGAALDRLPGGDYDLLITDIELPGDTGLELVHALAQSAPGLPVIIVTGFPTMDSAIHSVELPVCAYLVKPFEHAVLRSHVDEALTRSRGLQAVRRTGQRLARTNEDFRDMLEASTSAGTSGRQGVDAFIAFTLGNVTASLQDLQRLGQALAGHAPEKQPCQLLDCPRGAQLQAALRETIDVLEETKSAFKSKTLADLRKKLELLMQHG